MRKEKWEKYAGRCGYGSMDRTSRLAVKLLHEEVPAVPGSRDCVQLAEWRNEFSPPVS